MAGNRIGGIKAVLLGCYHNSDAWGVEDYPYGATLSNEEASKINFVKYQKVTEYWWDYFLNDNKGSLDLLDEELSKTGEWDADYALDELLP